MFLLTGVIELVEELYHYFCLTKDLGFVKSIWALWSAGFALQSGFWMGMAAFGAMCIMKIKS